MTKFLHHVKILWWRLLLKLGTLPGISGGAGETDPSAYNVSPDASVPNVLIIPQVQHQETLVNLAAGASIDFFFQLDFGPILDTFVFADQVITQRVFVRQSTLDTYRQLGGDNAGTANTLVQLSNGARLPGSQLRLRFINLSGAGTTAISIQAHVRSN
jgi:hypothetical protein